MTTCRRTLIAALILASAPLMAAPVATQNETGATLANAALRVEFSFADEHWRMTRLARPDGSDALTLDADAIGIVVYEGAELDAEDFRVESVRADNADGSVTARLVCADPPLTAVLRYRLAGDDPYLRMTISFPEAQDTVIDELRLLQARTDEPITGGGKGLPVLVGNAWWFGAEYPAFFAEVSEGAFTLKHYPGRAPDGTWQSKTMVCGVAPEGVSLELAFDDYLRSIKRPSRSFLQYNSWYDWRGEQMTVENFRETATGFKQHLLDPHGLQMDAYVPDDGWQNPQSVWEPRADIYPDGLSPLATMFESLGARMGIWMPLFGVRLDIAWAREQGYEISSGGGSYCIAGPKSFEAMKAATQRVIEQANLNYYKHDFNALHCSADGHGHLPTSRHGYEANLDAEIKLLAWERECQPGIFLNVTSNVWLSPWWLQHADTIWMCARDFGFDKSFPQLSRREWAMSYRDAHFYRVYQREHNPTPLASLMTHGIIKGKRNRLGGKSETLREWADYVALYYGRGVLLKELYVSPEILDDDQWRVLGAATRWATDNWETLERTRMIGGEPGRGQPYGFAHWREDHGIVALRNPSYRAMTMRVPVDQTAGYRGPPGTTFAAREIYPAHLALADELSAGGDNEISLPPCSVTLLEMRTDANWPTTIPARAEAPRELNDLAEPAELATDAQGQQTLTISLPAIDTPHQRLDLYVIARGAGVKQPLAASEINGEAASARVAQGDEWVIYSCDLLPHLGVPVEFAARIAPPGGQPFAHPSLRAEAWLIGQAGQPTDTSPFATERLPWAIAQGCTSYSTQLLPETEVPRPAGHTITAEELANIKAAKLRIEIFDANGQAKYRGKQILIGETSVGEVPPNSGQLSAWQEKIVDLAPEHLGLLRLTNTLVLTNAGGDCYKFRGLALSVQKADGAWVDTDISERVCSSVTGWRYAEGDGFRDNRSPEITLSFPQP